MDRKLIARAEQIEIDATRDLFDAPSTEVAGELGLLTGIVGGAWAFGSRAITDIIMNRVIGLGVFGAARRDDLDRIADGYGAAGIDRYLVHVAPQAQPAEIASWLEAAGYRPFRRAWAKFGRKAEWLDAPGPATLAAVEIGPERAADFARIVTEVFGLPEAASRLVAALPGRPSWICYLATDSGTPIASAAMYTRGRDAWLGFGATDPAARGRGAQKLLLSRRISDAARLGASDVFTETGEAVEGEPQPSYQNILKVGFKRLYSRANLVSPSPEGVEAGS
jgi:GNAT superfamily N-acetyltransferase